MVLASMTAAASALVGMSEEAVTVDFHPYLLAFQVGLFVVLMLVLKPVLFDPMLKLFEEREKRTAGAKAAARKIDEKSASALATYEEAMAKARATANAERDKLRAEGLKIENDLLAKVRATTAQTLEDGKQKAHAEAARVRATLEGESGALAKDLASRVLGREVQG